jgi:CDP-glucose 4,6-dehydratase
MPTNTFWKNKPVLVTGATGFVGSALCALLRDRGARVVGLVRDEVVETNFDRLNLARSINVVRGNLEDYSLVERAINEYAVEVVYHLGAQAIVGTANRSPVATFKANIEGTWNVLEACRGKSHVAAIIVASSDKAYGSHEELPYTEEFALRPEYPYDVSKACADLIAQTYFKTYGLPVVVTRFANIYGPGDTNISRIVPDTIRSVLAGQSPLIRSDGTPERDYLYIDDVVDFYALLAERIEDARGQVFNAGHQRPVKVIDLVETILCIAGRTDLVPEIRGKATPPGEIDRQWLSGEKAHKVLGWAPRVGLEEGVRRTIDWYRSLKGQQARGLHAER